LAEALRRGVGSVSLQDVQSELAGHGILRHERDGERLVSTRAVLTEEQGLLQFAREGRASVEPLVTGHVFRREWLNDEQKSAVRAVLESTDRVTLIRGVAGTGKTTLTKEAVEAITRAGTPVVMVAPTSQSARGVLRDQEGFSEADTLQRLLVDSRMQARLDKAVLWIDEAGLVGCRDMARVFELARSHDARVVLMGDSKQHRAVARGGMMRLLEQQAGLRTIQVSDIRRQSGRYRSAVAAFASERTDEGLGIIEELGWLHEGTDGEQHQQLARDFADATGRGDDVLVVSPTHFEGRLVTDAIRDELRSRELLGADHAVPRLIPLHWTEADRASPASYRDAASPLVVQFEQNAKGFQRGDRAEVLEWGGEGVRVRLSSGVVKDLPLESPARFTVYRTDTTQIASGDRVRLTHNASINGRRLNNGAVYTVKSVTPDGAVTLDGGPTLPAGFGFLDHGWVVTSHSAQGRTHDRVFVAASSESLGAINRAQTYVSASRGRYQVAVYTDDKDALKKAAERADRSLTATELVAPVQRAKGKARRHVMFLQRMASRLSDYASRVVDTFRGHVREEEHSRRLGYGR
jgi:hypothetical protein